MRFSEFIKESTGITHSALSKKVEKMYDKHKTGNADFETVKLQKNVHTGATKYASGTVKAHSLAYRPITRGNITKTYIPHPMVKQVRLLINKHGGKILGHASQGNEGGFIDTSDGYRHHFTRQLGSNYSTFDHSVHKKQISEEMNLEEEFGHPDQKTMHKVLRSHGWAPAKKAEYKTNASLKGEHISDKIKGYEGLGARSADSMTAYAKQVRHYTHPDHPHESVETSPAGSEYNVWAHYQGHLPGKERNGFQYLGGKRGKSGKAIDLGQHLTAYKQRPVKF